MFITGWFGCGALPHDPHSASLCLLLDCRLLSQVAHTKIYPENVSLYVQAADEEVVSYPSR